ncbi:hypothetical protein [Streptomyces sp. NRRL F-4474]|uniref:hypothetical protein n=1 Tax=Streptomyces sp. NRRL F-4474 TaxID=1463851 RepID=UPI0004C4E2A7|nr:hypothetical protein [Streptomyces sp. NRRL F-4474]
MVAIAQRGHGVEGLAEDVVVGGGQGLDGRWERASGPGEGLGGHAGGRAGELELLVALAGLLLQQVLELGVLGDVAEGQRGVVDQEEVLGGEAVVEGAGAGCADHLDREAALHGYLVGTQVAGGGGETDDHRVGGRFGEEALSEVGGIRSFSLPRPMKLPEPTHSLCRNSTLSIAGAEGDEVQAARLAVVLQPVRGKRGAVGGAPPDDPADVGVGENRQFRVARVHPADVGAEGGLQAARIAGVAEVVDLVRILTDGRVVALRGQGQRCAAAPTPDELGGQQFAFGLGAGVGVQPLVEGGDVGVVLTEDDVRAVAAQDVRGRHGQRYTCLARVAEQELACFDRAAVAGQRFGAAALYHRLAEAVPVSEDVEPVGSEVLVRQQPYPRDLTQLLLVGGDLCPPVSSLAA